MTDTTIRCRCGQPFEGVARPYWDHLAQGCALPGGSRRLAAVAARMREEILDLIDEGTIPRCARTFSDLHDYIDANTLAGLCDDGPGGNVDITTEELVVIQDGVHDWLLAGRPVG
jgi:hypothetical protein